MAKTIKLPSGSKMEYFGLMLEILNILQPEREKRITSTEKDVLVAFFLLDPEKFRYHRFSRVAKKKVIELFEAMGQTLTKENLNFKIYRLIDKGYLTRDEDNIVTLKGYLDDFLYQAYDALNKGKPFQVNIQLLTRKDFKDYEEEAQGDTEEKEEVNQEQTEVPNKRPQRSVQTNSGDDRNVTILGEGGDNE